MISANIAAGTIVPTQQVTIQSKPQVAPTAPPPLVEIKLDEVPDEAEPRVVVDAVPEEEEESIEDEDEEEEPEIELGLEQAEEEEEGWELCSVNPRKRPSHDIDDDEEDVHDEAERFIRNRRSGSLSKRLRREEDYIKDIPAAPLTRLKKRSSEELDDDEGAEDTFSLGGRDIASPKKRSRLDSTPSDSPPISTIGTSTGDSDSTPMIGDESDEQDLSSTGPHGVGSKSSASMLYAQHPRGLTSTSSSTPISMSEMEMAKLYSFDSASGLTASLDGSEVDA